MVVERSDTKSASPSSTTTCRYLRNASFRNRIKEFSVVAYFDLFPNESTYISRVKWTPYIYLGIAGFLANHKARHLLLICKQCPEGRPENG